MLSRGTWLGGLEWLGRIWMLKHWRSKGWSSTPTEKHGYTVKTHPNQNVPSDSSKRPIFCESKCPKHSLSLFNHNAGNHNLDREHFLCTYWPKCPMWKFVTVKRPQVTVLTLGRFDIATFWHWDILTDNQIMCKCISQKLLPDNMSASLSGWVHSGIRKNKLWWKMMIGQKHDILTHQYKLQCE